MFEWVTLDDFRLMTGVVTCRYNGENMQDVVNKARSHLHDWTDQQAEDVLETLLNECEEYSSSLVQHVESERIDLLEYCRDDFSWKDDFEVDTDTCWFIWKTEDEAFDLSVQDVLGEDTILDIVISYEGYVPQNG